MQLASRTSASVARPGIARRAFGGNSPEGPLRRPCTGKANKACQDLLLFARRPACRKEQTSGFRTDQILALDTQRCQRTADCAKVLAASRQDVLLEGSSDSVRKQSSASSGAVAVMHLRLRNDVDWHREWAAAIVEFSCDPDDVGRCR
jgi:hypothetical protein